MADYLSRTDVENRLRRSYETLYKRAGAVDTDLIDADIEQAEAEVNSYLAQRNTVPITDTMALRVIRSWSLTLVEELAYGAIPGRKLPESVATRAKAVRVQLAKAADGTLSLGAAQTPSERAAAAEAIIVDAVDPVFGRDNMKGF